jgi:hypothetical protein
MPGKKRKSRLPRARLSLALISSHGRSIWLCWRRRQKGEKKTEGVNESKGHDRKASLRLNHLDWPIPI